MINNKNKENKIKIALICYSLSIGGLERIVSNVSFLFTQMGFEVDIYVLRSEVDYPFSGNLHKYDIDKCSRINKIKKYLQLKNDIKKNQPDIILDQRYRLNLISEFFWQYIIYAGQKVVNYIHNSRLQKYIFSRPWVNNFIFRKRLFICVSKGIEKKVNKKFPKLKTEVIYNAVFANIEEKTSVSHTPFIVAVARMDESNVKQIDVLLDCFSKSELPKNNFNLVIIGSGVRQKQMEKMATELGLSDKVIFKGFLANPYQFIKNAYFTVLTSREEGLPTILIESLLLGTPVISFDCETGPNEIIIHEENGILVENQNKKALIEAMNRMIFEPKLHAKLKLNSVISAEKFTTHQSRLKWEEFFDKEFTNDKSIYKKYF